MISETVAEEIVGCNSCGISDLRHVVFIRGAYQKCSVPHCILSLSTIIRAVHTDATLVVVAVCVCVFFWCVVNYGHFC